MSTCHTGSRFARHLENIPRVHDDEEGLYWKSDKPSLIRWRRIPEVNLQNTYKIFRKQLSRVVENVVESKDSSQLKSTSHTRNRFARHLENIPQVGIKWG